MKLPIFSFCFPQCLLYFVKHSNHNNFSIFIWELQCLDYLWSVVILLFDFVLSLEKPYPLIECVLLLLLLLSCFSLVRLSATPETAAHQAPPFLGFSRQEHWSGLPFPSPMHESEKWKWIQLCPTLSDPRDCSLPGSSVHGIFQARVLEYSRHCLLRCSL